MVVGMTELQGIESVDPRESESNALYRGFVVNAERTARDGTPGRIECYFFAKRTHVTALEGLPAGNEIANSNDPPRASVHTILVRSA